MRHLFFVLLFIFCLHGYGQSIDSLIAKADSYGSHTNSDLLFVHTDKHIYTNNEWVWFSAYLLNTKVDSVAAHRFMSVALVQAGTRQVVMQRKFVMSDGLSQGSINLPDSIAPGEYSLLAYTNMMGADSLPVATFTQKLSIRTIHQPEFVASINVEKDSVVLISVTDKNTAMAIRGAEVIAWIGKKQTKGKTTKAGTFSVLIPGKQPGATINVRVKYKGEFTFLQTQLPRAEEKRTLQLYFYPESGDLISKAPCYVGWESKTDLGEPLAVVGILYKNDKPVDTIFTDEMGLGHFKLSPEYNGAYDVRVSKLPEGVHGKNKYSLPVVKNMGVSLHLTESLADDSLNLRIYAPGHKAVKMVVHNFKNIFTEQVFTMRYGGIKVLLLTEAYPRGLTAVTLFDAENKPVAERIFFAHYNDQVKLNITPDKKTYKKREKVTLRFQLSEGNSIPGIASIACAQANRYQLDKQRDIESFASLERDLEKLPTYTKEWVSEDTEYFENILLVRGWRQYTWQDMLSHTIEKPIFHSPTLHGKVNGVNGKIKKPVDVTIVGGANMYQTITTNEQGHFQLAYDDLIIPQDERFIIFAKRKDVVQGHVEILDPFTKINKKLAAQVDDSVINVGKFLKNSRDLALPDFDKVNYLPQFTVTAQSGVSNAMFGAHGANSCGDYVCHNNFLNCANHFATKAPVKGQSYFKHSTGGTYEIVVYKGCQEPDPDYAPYEGIKIGKQYYGENFSTKTDEVPELISTIYWSPMLVFDANGKAECSFYTSDITGPYRIVINGVAENQLFFGTSVIEVK